MSNLTLTTSTELGWSAKVSRQAGVLWISSAGPVVILLLLKSLRWWKKNSERLLKCYIRSEPKRRGQRKRMLGFVHGKLLTPHWVNWIYWAETRQETRLWSLSNSMVNLETVIDIRWCSGFGRSTSERTLSSYSFSPLLFIVVMLPLNGCLHTIKNVARLYLPIKEGRGRGFIGIEEL